MTYEIKTSFAFPTMVLNTIIKYTRVEKPSGVSYFLLVLINENKNKNANLAETLKICGVPEDLYSIFADELQKLIKSKILTLTKYEYNKRNFEEYLISNFKFTNDGKKIFLDEMIPLDHSEETKQAVLYSPAYNKMEINKNYNFRDSKISVLRDNFFKKLEVPTTEQIEDFLNTQKGRAIIVKKDEVILSVKTQKTQNGIDTFDCYINIHENDTVTFSFDDNRLKTFFEKHYNKDMINKDILSKREFGFMVETDYHSKLSDHLPIVDVYRPSDALNCYSKRAHLNIYQKGHESTNNKLSFNNDFILNNAYPNSAFLKIIDLNKGYTYIPTYVTLHNDVFGDIKLRLLIEKELTKEQIKQVFNNTVVFFTVYDDNNENIYNYKNLIELCKIDKTNQTIKNKIDEFINTDDIEETILILEKIKDDSTNNTQVYNYIKDIGLKLYMDLFKTVTIDNLEHYLFISSWIIRANEIDEIKELEMLFKHLTLKNDKDMLTAFNIFEKQMFDHKNIILFIKEIPQMLLKDNKIKNDLANNIKLLFNQFNFIKELTDVKDISNYILNDQINRDTYIKAFKSFTTTYNNLFYLKDYLKEEFVLLEEYNRLFLKLNEVYQYEEEAALNPKKITKTYLENIIKTKGILTAVANVYIKLTHIAKTTFSYYGKMFNFIDVLYKDKHLSKKEYDLFHKFRMYRNDLDHVNEKRVDISRDELLEITNIMFKLEEENNEPISSNSI